MMWITICVALFITIASNADTIVAARILWQNPTVRAAVVKQAEQRVTRPRPEGNGLFVQADYPDKDKPISDTSSGETGETAERDGGDEETEATEADTGLTEEEKAALGQMIGWSRDFKKINTNVCLARQKHINETCKKEELRRHRSARRPLTRDQQAACAFTGRMGWSRRMRSHGGRRSSRWRECTCLVGCSPRLRCRWARRSGSTR